MELIFTVKARLFFPDTEEIVEHSFGSSSSNIALLKALKWYNEIVGINDTENFQLILTLNGLTYKA